MKRLSATLFLALGLCLAGASCGLTTTVQVPINAKTVNTNLDTNTIACSAPAGTISYAGQDGKQALDLLQVGHKVDVTSAGFVNTIDDRKPNEHQYWAFYVNCKQADVGAKEFQTKSSDLIYWQLTSF